MEIVASASSEEEIALLKRCGVDVMINPALEASLEMTRLTLEHFDIEEEKVASMLAAYRTKHYNAGVPLQVLEEKER